MPRPLRHAIFENLEHCGSNVVLCVKPRYGYIFVERGFPLKASIGQSFHAEKGHRNAGEAEVIR